MWIGNPGAHRWRAWGRWRGGGGGALLRTIHHPERGAQGGYHRVRRGSARRSYPLHFRLSRARPRWLPEGSIHHGGEDGLGLRRAAGGSQTARRGRGPQEPEAPSDTRKGMGGGIWVRFSTLGRRRALCPGEVTGRGWIRPRPGAQAGCWSAAPWVSGLTLLGWGAACRGERVFTPALGRGVLSVGPAPGPSRVTQARAARASWGRPEERPYFISPRC